MAKGASPSVWCVKRSKTEEVMEQMYSIRAFRQHVHRLLPPPSAFSTSAPIGQDPNQREVRMIEDHFVSHRVDRDMMWHCGENGGFVWRRQRGCKWCLNRNRGFWLTGGFACSGDRYALMRSTLQSVGVRVRSRSLQGFFRGLHITMKGSSRYLYFQSYRPRGDKLHVLVSHSTRFCITQHLFKKRSFVHWSRTLVAPFSARACVTLNTFLQCSKFNGESVVKAH